MRTYIKILIIALSIKFIPLYGELTLPKIKSLIEKYGPVVYIYPNDASSPTSVDWYIKRCNLMYRDKNGKTEIILKNNQLNPTILGTYAKDPHGGEYYLDPINKKETYKGQGYDMQNFSLAQCYVNVVERSTGIVVLQFHFFWAYQGSITIAPVLDQFLKTMDIGIHEGDWEHVNIYLKPVQNTYEIEQVFFSRHQQRKGELVSKNNIEFVDDTLKSNRNGTHPVVYAAKNSHASYSTEVMLSKYVDKTSKAGPRWKCWEQAIYLGTTSKPQPGQEWIKFAGRWGSTIEDTAVGIEYHGNSPEGPASGSTFLRQGQEKRNIEITSNGKRIKAVPFSIKYTKQQRVSKRYSPYFDLEVPARIKRLEFYVQDPENILKSFEIWVSKTILNDQQILQLKPNAFATKAKPSILNGLYIGNVVTNKPEINDFKFELQIVGIEE